MTKQELRTIEELTKRIEMLEAVISKQNDLLTSLSMSSITSHDTKSARTPSKKSESAPVESKDSKSKKTESVVIGNLIFSGKYVKTGSGYMNSKTRYAIQMAITEKFGGAKLAKGNPIYDKCHKEDKYVQVYEFKTVADCKKFMAEQEKRVG